MKKLLKIFSSKKSRNNPLKEEVVDPRKLKGPAMDLVTYHKENDTDVWWEYKHKKKEVVCNRIEEILREKVTRLNANDIYNFMKRGKNIDVRITEKSFTKFHNIDHLDVELRYSKDSIRSLCEEMYYDGRIGRTGNYKYFFLI